MNTTSPSQSRGGFSFEVIMTRYFLTMAIFAAAFTLAACASNRDMFGHNDGIDQNTNAAIVGALRGM